MPLRIILVNVPLKHFHLFSDQGFRVILLKFLNRVWIARFLFTPIFEIQNILLIGYTDTLKTLFVKWIVLKETLFITQLPTSRYDDCDSRFVISVDDRL